MRQTPTTPDGLRQLDELPAVEAVLRAWTDAGSQPQWHEQCKDELRDAMPLLARALDRLAAEAGK